jgi:hypothetical protein
MSQPVKRKLVVCGGSGFLGQFIRSIPASNGDSQINQEVEYAKPVLPVDGMLLQLGNHLSSILRVKHKHLHS